MKGNIEKAIILLESRLRLLRSVLALVNSNDLDLDNCREASRLLALTNEQIGAIELGNILNIPQKEAWMLKRKLLKGGPYPMKRNYILINSLYEN